MDQKVKDNYTSDSIKVLKNLEPVKQHPAMYTYVTNPNHIIFEVIDNSIDEILAGFGNRVQVTLFKDGSVMVEDDGRGIPVDVHKDEGVSALEVVLSVLHAGGKLEKGSSSSAYKDSGGLHGVGVSVTNALSSFLIATVKRDSKVYQISFKDGYVDKKIEVIGACGANETGTTMFFKPDPKYFNSPIYDKKEIVETLEIKSAILKNVEVNIVIEDGESFNFSYKNGIVDYFKNKTKLSDSAIFSGETEKDSEEGAEWVLSWFSEKSIKKSFVNMINTKEGGTHEAGLKSALFESLQNYLEVNDLLPKNLKITQEDVFSDVDFVLSMRMVEVSFQGQTKEKLNTSRGKSLAYGSIKHKLDTWLNINPSVAKDIVDMVIRNANARVRKNKKNIGNAYKDRTLPIKLKDCESKNPDLNELFIVEGDSAGGSACQGRDKTFQAILPLKGKILNSWELDSEKILESEEVNNIKQSIGVDPHGLDDDVDLKDLRYKKILILPDADDDGCHIASLACALFLKHFPKIIENGYLYICVPPLYSVYMPAKGKREEFRAYPKDDKELNTILKDFEKKKIQNSDYLLSRFKGLGEMNPDELCDTTLNPEKRTIIQVTVDDFNDTSIMDMLFCKKAVAERKDWIFEEGDFNE